MKTTLLSIGQCFAALLAALLLLALPAQAANYTLPGNLPPGCSGSNGTYICEAALTLAAGDTISLASPTPATLRIGGMLTLLDQSSINASGAAADLRITVEGDIAMSSDVVIRANINAVSASNLGKSVVIEGSLTTSAALQIGDLCRLTGSIASTSGAITVGQGGLITGNIFSVGGAVVVDIGAQVGGNIRTNAAITLNISSRVGGSLSTDAAISMKPYSTLVGDAVSSVGGVTLAPFASVGGDIKTEGAVSMADHTLVSGSIMGGAGAANLAPYAEVKGYITTGAGAVTFGDSAQVTGAITTGAGAISLGANAIARSCVQSTTPSAITIGANARVNSVCCGNSSNCTNTCVTDGASFGMPPLCSAKSTFDHFNISGAGAASTCAPQTLTVSARDSNNNVLSSYTGTAALSSSSGRGNWQIGSPAPAGVFSAGASNSGRASYSFAAADQGVVALSFSHSLAQDVTVSVSDSATAIVNSALLQFRDNAFVWAEDLANLISGSGVAVAGRDHDLQVALIKKDASSGSCGIATDYSGSRNLKLWRSDSGGPWAAPALVSPALSLPAARPSANNLGLSFNAGVANLTLASSDIGKYSLTLEDDSLFYAATAVVGSLPDLTVRPFALVLNGLTFTSTGTSSSIPNPNGSAANDASFGVAGGNFSATLAAYRWSSAADTNNDGVPDGNATLGQVTAGGLTASFNSASTLTPLSGSQTPTSGVLGQLLNGTLGSFTSGSTTAANLRYSEVGSFLLNGSGWVSNFLATSGLKLDGLVFNASGAQNARVGRFVPADFALSASSVVNRVVANCLPASSFSYLDENFALRFTLTARNALGDTTLNYSGDFAKLDLATAGNFQLAGLQGSTLFKSSATAGSPARLVLGSSSGSWTQGVAANINLPAQALRGTTPDGPFDSAAFGIAPLDSDGVALAAASLDLAIDTASSPDHARVASLNLRYGRLRLQNAIGSQDRPLKLPLLAQYWTPSGYQTNTLDSCSRIAAAHLSFGNFRKALSAADLGSSGGFTLKQGMASLTLAKPGSGHRGSVDVAISLGASAADASCLQPWAPSPVASAGANLSFLRANWCSASSSADPSARATFGLYRGSDALVYQRENY